jgi:hypothetical protein
MEGSKTDKFLEVLNEPEYKRMALRIRLYRKEAYKISQWEL